jgi:peroxidase
MGLLRSDYSQNIDPAVKNNFATAALQFLYSMMPGNFKYDFKIIIKRINLLQKKNFFSLYSSSRNLNSTLRLREHFNKPGVLHQDGRMDQLLRTMATQNAQKVDLVHTEEVSK